MTIAEAERFYKTDAKAYIPTHNKEFMTWLYEHLKKGYNPYLSLEEMNTLVKKIKDWYELKLPNRKLELQEGVTSLFFEGINDITEHMDFDQLRYRLTHEELQTLDCKYRSYCGHCQPDWGNFDELVTEGQGWVDFIGFKVNATYPETSTIVRLMSATAVGGLIPPYEMARLEDFLDPTPKQNITIPELITIIKGSSNMESSELDFIEYTHQTDLELRNKLLNMAALSLIYSRNTTPEYGKKRALILMDETVSKYSEPLTFSSIESVMGEKVEKKSKIESLQLLGLTRKVKKLERKINKK